LPFFAAAQTSGTVDVRLHPTEVVPLNTSTLVTFGFPFPRGSITAAQLNTVRVTRNGNEVAAHVEQLTPWRHRSNAAVDGQSVRVALIQIQASFASGFPNFDTITVHWGGVPRALDIPVRVDPRSAWHQVTAGSFVAADNVFEPDVYAVLPRAWLAHGVFRAVRSLAFDASNTDARDNPATNDGIAHWPGTQEAERAFKNNFYSVINRDDPNVAVANYCPYKVDREPWLYDRAATMFALYFRSGSFLALREAVQAAQYYANRVDAQGFFTLAPGDAKYAYNESIAYDYWLAGDVAILPKVNQVVSALSGFPHAWTAQRNFWTERHAAFKLLGNVVAYEVNGGATLRDAVNQILADFRTHQDGAGGAIPAQRIDGGLYHLGSQHDGDWAAGSLGASSWMSALLGDAVARAYATGEDAATAQFMRRLGLFLVATVVNTTEHDYDFNGALALPRYAMLLDGSDGQRNTSDVEHALDVAGQIAWARYFSETIGASGAALLSSANALYATYDEGVNFWIRPAGPASGLTAFRVSPWRKWGWEHRTSPALSFALSDVPPIFANGFE
jgi:hypothetical protein